MNRAWPVSSLTQRFLIQLQYKNYESQAIRNSLLARL